MGYRTPRTGLAISPFKHFWTVCEWPWLKRSSGQPISDVNIAHPFPYGKYLLGRSLTMLNKLLRNRIWQRFRTLHKRFAHMPLMSQCSTFSSTIIAFENLKFPNPWYDLDKAILPTTACVEHRVEAQEELSK